MTYRVELTQQALDELDALYDEKRADQSEAAAKWFNSLVATFPTLQHLPQRCPRIPERVDARELRHLLHGKKPHIYRVIYEVIQERATVRILSIRHGARLPLLSSDLPPN